MRLSRDVIVDLLPVYMSGDASDATKAIVDDYLRSDPDLAAQVRAGTALRFDAPASGAPSPALEAQALEVRALQIARRRLALMRWLFGLACFSSAISLGIEVRRDNGHVDVALLLMRYPRTMIAPAIIALALWIAYFALRRARASDLS